MSKPKGRSLLLKLKLDSVSSGTSGLITCVLSGWVKLVDVALHFDGPAGSSVVSVGHFVAFLGLYLCGPPL